MILKGSQRAGAKQLAVHLLNNEENEHIEIHEVRGFMSDKAEHAFKEMYAISHGTRCKQFMFSLSLSPPAHESVGIGVFEKAIRDVEQKLGLTNQPRIVVFHEKEGRRHAHCVWSRIDAENMKAINLAHYPLKLRSLARELFLENGWQLPKGYINSQERDPYNFTLAEWQQSKRTGESPQAIKDTLRECWAASDNKQSFIAELEARGFTLAQGDRRGYVAVDYRGEVYSLSRQTGAKAKELHARLGDSILLPTVEEVKTTISQRMTHTLKKHQQQILEHTRREAIPLMQERKEMTASYCQEREKLQKLQQQRWRKEEIARAKLLSKGLRGIWHKITGHYQKIQKWNEEEIKTCLTHDRDQKQALIDRQLEERRSLQQRIVSLRQKHRQNMQYLREDIAHYFKLAQTQEATAHKALSQGKGRERKQEQSRSQKRKNRPEQSF